MTTEQETALTQVNNVWGAARWEEKEDGTLHVTLDDGDTVDIALDGTTTENW